MSRIRGTNTKPEIALRKALWALGLRYRLNVKKLPGKPDIVIGKHKLAIFVDGEFWHGYDWNAKKPKIKSNAEYWVKKIEGNMARDQNNNEKLRSKGFLVLRFWEQELRKDIDGCVRQILKAADTRTT